MTQQSRDRYELIPQEELVAQFTSRLRDVLLDLEAEAAPMIVVRKLTMTAVSQDPLQITVVRREATPPRLTAADVYNESGLPRYDEFFLPGRVGSWQRRLIRIPGAYRTARWFFRRTDRGREEVARREQLLKSE